VDGRTDNEGRNELEYVVLGFGEPVARTFVGKLVGSCDVEGNRLLMVDGWADCEGKRV